MTVHDISPDGGYGAAIGPDDYERRALAGAFYSGRAACHLASFLRPEDFSIPKWRELLRAILAQRQAGGYQDGPIDAAAILEAAENPEGSTNEGMQQALIDALEEMPYTQFHEHYCAKVLEHSRLRQIRDIGEMLRTEEDESNRLLDLARERLENVAKLGSSPVKSVSKMAEPIADMLIAHSDTGGGLMGYHTGFTSLDRVTDGWPIAGVTVIGARPSVGKTALGLVLARNMVLDGHAVLYFSLEMSDRALMERLFSISARKSARALRWRSDRGEVTQAIMEGCDAASELERFYIDDTAGLTVQQVVSRAMQAQRSHGVDAVVIDHLHLLSSGEKTESQTHEFTRISAGLTFGAKATGVPFLVLAQLNRSTEAKRDRPTLSTLRQSGAIEQDADMVLLLHRDDYQNPKDCPEDRKNILEVNVAKNRNGPTGVVDFHYDRESGYIQEQTPEEPRPHWQDGEG